MSYDYFDSLPGAARERYRLKLDSVGLNQCPYRLPAGTWVDNLLKWPSLQFGHVYTYLIKSPGIYSTQAMENYKSLEAHRFFSAGWVQTVYLHETTTGVIILKTQVRPSMRVNADPHNPWVALEISGKVLAAHCDCMAGLGESCSHVGAVLFKVEAAVREGLTSVACTDLPCTWNATFATNVVPARVADIDFYSSEAKTKLKTGSRKKQRTCDLRCSQQQRESFPDSLSAMEGCTPVALSLFNQHSAKFISKPAGRVSHQLRLPLKLKTLYDATASPLTVGSPEMNSKCEFALKTITENLPTAAQIDFLEEATIAQANCPAWHEQRVGVITGSVVYDVMNTNFERPSKSCVKKVCTINTTSLNVPELRHGREGEERAFRYVRENQTVLNPDLGYCVQKVGMRVLQQKPWIGASADGMITCTCHGKCALEIKCPYTFRTSFVKDMFGHPKSFLDKSGSLKKSHRYYYQVQLQMLVYNVMYCDFLVMCKDYHHELIAFDKDFCDNMLEHITKFWKRHILPELVCRPIEPASSLENKENVELFCYCQKPEDDKPYIGCDEPKCKFKWIHLTCANLKRPPKGNFFCKYCI